MNYRHAAIVGALAAALAAGGCTRDAAEVREETAEAARDADRAVEQQRQRDEEITRLDQRVTNVEREYAEVRQKVVTGSRTATAGLREEVQEDRYGRRKRPNQEQRCEERHVYTVLERADRYAISARSSGCDVSSRQ